MKVEISRQEAKELYEATRKLKYRILSEMVEDMDEDLREFLLNHEHDIATDFEDYSLLKAVFRKVIGREPTYNLRRQ